MDSTNMHKNYLTPSTFQLQQKKFKVQDIGAHVYACVCVSD